MKANKKALALVLCALMLVAASVFGTLAYLTDTDAVTNTFTVGKVDIKLDEADVNIYGEAIDDAERVAANEYHLIPGHTYTKDPMVTVLAGSEESYVRMMVEINFSKELDEIFGDAGANLLTIFNGYTAANWEYIDNTEDTVNNTRTYEFRYIGTENKGSKDGTVAMTREDTHEDNKPLTDKAEIKLDPLFDSFTVPTWFDNANLEKLIKLNANGEIIDQFTIRVTAHAIQADGFDTADDAWEAFAEQGKTAAGNPEYPAETTDAIDDGDNIDG